MTSWYVDIITTKKGTKNAERIHCDDRFIAWSTYCDECDAAEDRAEGRVEVIMSRKDGDTVTEENAVLYRYGRISRR